MTRPTRLRHRLRLRAALPIALAATTLAATTLLSGCGPESAADAGPKLALDAALPTKVPDGTKIVVGDPATEVALKLSGKYDAVSKFVKFANIAGGPATTEAFRANALDVGSVADIPPIQATWTGLKVRIVAAKYRADPIHHPLYALGIAPGVHVKTLADLRGKKIAYSPGQAQGALVLRVLEKAGLTQQDVDLVELPSTEDVYLTTLAAKELDVAPLGGVQIKRYLAQYGKDGATVIAHGLKDDPSHLYTQVSSLENAAKAAAIREYVAYWGAAQRWIQDHPKEWLEGYYVKDQGLTVEDGQWLIDNAGDALVPTDWTEKIAEHQATIDLLAKEQGQPGFDAASIWDRRFEKVGGTAFESGETP